MAATTTKVSDVIHTYRPSRKFPTPGNHYTSIDFDDTGEFLLLSRSDDTIQLFNTKAGQHAKELKSQKYGSALARFTHNSTSIVYASTKVDDGIRYLSMHDNSFIRYFKGHTARVTSLSMSPGNDQFLSAGLDNTVKLWDCRSSMAQGQLDFESPYLTSFDPSGSVIAIASPPAQTVHLYDYRNYDKPPFATFDLLSLEQSLSASHGQKPAQGWTGMEFSNNGKYILLSTNGPGHYILDAFSGDMVAYLHRASGSTQRLAPGDDLESAGTGSTYLQSDATFAPDGQFVIGGNGGQAGLLVWDLRELMTNAPDGDKILEPKWDLPSQKPAAVVAHCPRLNLIASADRDVLLWVPDPDAA
ncbi:uncharacterized protein LTR77_007438 [Saxophila tyrrhenica]|uniref:WD repeat-containing protein 82 n=1 Tax=Saxophila tyrrhenica TaxID=1690608 RepID=A0AAV9P821_9PEZI|nr:hypothetical protein LTR77_007438 [Saxophila tyrrhenica]